MKGFYKPGNNQKKTQKFDTRFWECIQSIKMNDQGCFPFSKSTKKSKMNFPIDITSYPYPYKT